MHYYDLPVSMTPVLSLLLEPCSLVVTTCDQYTTRGHGIDAVIEDRVRISELANVGMLGSGGSWGAAPHTGDSSSSNSDVVLLRRQTRYSLTCRDVARVMNVGIGTRKVV
jgi:alkylated DNA repair protein alkB homolog 6